MLRYGIKLFCFRNGNAQVLIMTGSGQFYSNGLDLDWLSAVRQAEGNDARSKHIEDITKLTARILTFPIPTIAALNGTEIMIRDRSLNMGGGGGRRISSNSLRKNEWPPLQTLRKIQWPPLQTSRKNIFFNNSLHAI